MSTAATSCDSQWRIDVVSEHDLVELLPLMRSYCAFYKQTEQIPSPTDDDLLSLSRALIADPCHEGIQLIARDTKQNTAVGFASLFWGWSTLGGGRLALMNDLFIVEQY